MEIKDKVALVTGGGSGIGAATSLRLAKEGASVVVADVNEDGGRDTVTQIESNGGKAAFVRADVTGPKDAEAMIAFAKETFGGLDILHNNAGILDGPDRYPDADPAQWLPVLEVNLRGVILGTQYGIQAMRERGGGCIVNMASMAGLGFGYPPNPVYAASKGGVVLFTASLAPLKDSDNIRVNCICPGVVNTPMARGGIPALAEQSEEAAKLIESLNMIPPEEIADIVVQFITDDSLAGQAMMARNGRERQLAATAAAPKEWRGS